MVVDVCVIDYGMIIVFIAYPVLRLDLRNARQFSQIIMGVNGAFVPRTVKNLGLRVNFVLRYA